MTFTMLKTLNKCSVACSHHVTMTQCFNPAI